MPDISVEHLIDRAKSAAPAAGRPRQTDLRRGVSDAYYALFHRLTAAVVEESARHVPQSTAKSFRRSLAHGALRSTCQSVATGKNLPAPTSLSHPAAQDPNAVQLAQDFVDLQEERHLADYAHDEVFGLVRLTDAIDLAERGIQSLDDHQQDAGVASLLLLLALTTSWRRPASP